MGGWGGGVGELVREVKEYDRVGVEWEREFLGLGNISLSILSLSFLG